MYKACIFDLDGTLTDTISSIAYYANNALNFYALPSIEVNRYKKLVGDGAKNLIERMLAEVGAESSPKLFQNVYDHYMKAYDNDVLYLTTVYDGIKELLQFLKENDVAICVLSNKPDSTAGMVIDELFGKNYFDICWGSLDFRKLKPDPTSAINQAELLGVKPDECMYVGDTATDMRTGKSAGMFTIGVLWGFRDYEELSSNNADLIVSHPKEIQEFYQKSID